MKSLKNILLIAILLGTGLSLSSCQYWRVGRIQKIDDDRYVVEASYLEDYWLISYKYAYLAVCDADGSGNLDCKVGEDGNTWFDSALHSRGFGPDKKK